MLQRGQVLDFYKESLGVPYYLYFLIDPRNDKVCYIGLTKQIFQKRLKQHRSPKSTNQAAIAKLQRHLKTQNMTLNGEIVAKGSKEFIEMLEKWAISGHRLYLGRKSIKNHQAGGSDTYGCSEESKKKAWETRTAKKEAGEIKFLQGESSNTHKVKENEVLQIYEMINKGYTNNEIIEHLKLPIGRTGLAQIRKGKNWNYLFIRENMKIIPSMNVVEGALGSQEKIQVMTLIEQGKTNKDIQKMYKLQSTDIERIRNKTLWKMAWNVYENYYKSNQNKCI